MNEPFFKISAARNAKVLTRKEKQNREVSWNPRFFVEKMPEYDAAKDRYLQSLLSTLKNKKFAPKSRKIKLRSPNTVQKSASSKRLAYVQVNRLETLSKIRSELESAYISKGIPIEFFKDLGECVEGLDLKVSIVLLNKHLQDLLNDKSLVQIAIKTVKVRERFLQQIQDTIALGQVDRKIAADFISIVSVYSIQAVEAIVQWRDYMQQINPALPRQSFWYHEKNYLAKMAKDLMFLKESILVKALESQIVFKFIPNFCEKKIKNFTKRLLDAESCISEEVSPGFKESVFELRSKKSEKKIGDGSFNGLKTKNLDSQDTRSVEKLNIESNESQINLESPCEIIETNGDILPQIQAFNKSIPDQIKKCLGDAESAYSTSLSLKFPSYLWVKIQNSNLGFFILNLETQKTQQKRLFLSHISAKSLEALEKVIEAAINYCKSSYNCDEIRVSLSSPQNAEGKYESDKSIKRFFDNLGFRWKVLIKDRTDFPVHILGLVVPKSESFKTSDLFQDSLKFSYACFAQKTTSRFEGSCGLSDVGQALVLNALASSSSESKENLDFEGFSSSVKGILSKITQKWSPPAFKVSEHNSLDSVNQETSKLGLHFENLEDKRTILSMCSVELNWLKFLTTCWQNKRYLILNCQINVMSSNSKSVYIIPTEDPSFSVFLIPHIPESPIPDALTNSKEILSSLSKTQEQLHELWLPEFKVPSKSSACWKDFKIEETSELHVKAALHPKGNARLTPSKNALIISEGFLFGLINSRIDEEFEVPYMAVYVKPSDFTRLS